jgi:hypothetical protein
MPKCREWTLRNILKLHTITKQSQREIGRDIGLGVNFKLLMLKVLFVFIFKRGFLV